MEMFKLCDEVQAKEEGLITTDDMIKGFIEAGYTHTQLLKIFWDTLYDDELLEESAKENGWTKEHAMQGYLNLVNYIIRECI